MKNLLLYERILMSESLQRKSDFFRSFGEFKRIIEIVFELCVCELLEWNACEMLLSSDLFVIVSALPCNKILPGKIVELVKVCT